MLLNEYLWGRRSHPLFESEGEKGGGGKSESESKTDAESKEKSETKDDQKLGDAGIAALQKERDAREAAEKEAKRLKKLVDDAEAATKKREAEEAAAKGEFEKLANARQEEIDRLKADIAQKEREALKTKVGNAHKLPEPLIVLLQGDDEKTLEAHAKELAKHVKPPTAAETEAGAGNKGTSNGQGNKQDESGTTDVSKLPAYSFMPSRAIPIPQ